MGIFFTVGEKKKRPGVYQRYENVGGVSIAGATDGIVACCIRSNWGELSKVHTFESIEAAKLVLGNGGNDGTVSLLNTQGERLEGIRAAARIAGMAASTPSNQSLTHKVVTGMTDVIEMLTNSQYEQTIDAGMLTFSTSSSGNVWIESAITTLNMPQGEDDEGWKKIKRTKIRKELMNRASATVEPLIGNINNDDDGRATVLIAIGKLLQLLFVEGKLLDGAYIEIDKDNPPEGDSAYFNIYADDIDSLEKLYLVYKFRYSPNL